MADVVISGRHVEVPAQLRAHIDDKLAKVSKLAPKAMRVDVQISRERNPRLAEICDRVELTCVSAGPVIRAEAAAPEMTEAFDLAWAKLESRLRRAADRKRVHRGVRTPISVALATDLGVRTPRCTRLRSAARRSRDSSLAQARSKASVISGAAASARITGPADTQVSSTRSQISANRGLRSREICTSTRIALGASFGTFASLSSMCARSNAGTSTCRPLMTTSAIYP